MGWGIEVFGAIFSLSLTGSGAYLFWRLVSKHLDNRGYIQVADGLLKATLIFFSVPFVIQAMIWVQYKSDGTTEGNLFAPTEALDNMLLIFGILWLIGAIGTLLYQIGVYVLFCRNNKRSRIPGEPDQRKLYAECCEELGIRRRPRLYQCMDVRIPCQAGVLFPVIYIPMRSFPEWELRTIYTHELTHYKNRDLWWRQLAVLVRCIHWFNPTVYLIFRRVLTCNEYICDECSAATLGDRRKYFEVIVELARCNGERQRIYLVSMLSGNRNELVRRAEHLAKYEKITKGKKWIAVTFSAIFLVGGSATALAAGQGIAALHEAAYEVTVIEVEEDQDQWQNTLTEHVEYGTDEGIREEFADEGVSTYSNANIVTWTVKNDVIKKSATFPKEKGDTILVSVSITPSDKAVKVGVINSSGTKYYVESEGDIYHKFTALKSGNYRFFVENSCGVSVQVDGHYK